MRKVLILILMAFLCTLLIEAADFEHREIEIRAQAMGSALTAGNSGVGSIYTNPAGRATTSRELFMTYSDLFGIGFFHNNFAYAQSLFNGGVGFAYEKLTNSEDLFYEVSTFQLSYGRGSNLLPLNYGFTLRKLALNSEGGKADATCFDLGISGRGGNLAWGLVIFNSFAMTNPPSKLNSTPCEVKLGLAYQLPGTMVVGELATGKELKLGIERVISDSLALRAGCKNGTPTFGLGLSKGPWKIDYCFELGSLGYTNALGITRQF